jgi:hypothetical protein
MNAQTFLDDLGRNLRPKGFRSWLMWQVISAINWNSDHIIATSSYPSLMDAFGRRIDALLSRLWCWLYDGSIDEIRDGIHWALDTDMVPFDHRSPLQQEIAHNLDAWLAKWGKDAR